MRLGIVLIPTDPWHVSVARARELEAMGFQHLWTYDHLSWQRYREAPWHSALIWLAGIAAATSRIRLGTLVSSPNFRHPVTLAKEAMTLDHISGGRATLGIGAGGTGFDATVFGQPVLDPTERAARLADFLEVTDGLLHSDSYSSSNARYPVNDARMVPGPARTEGIPLAVAAAGKKTIGLAARYADAWITFGDARDPRPTPQSLEAAVARQSDLLEEQCALRGRDPSGIDRVLLVTNQAERPLGSLAAFEDFAAQYEAVGITDLVLHDPRAEDPVWNDDPAVLEQIAGAFLS